MLRSIGAVVGGYVLMVVLTMMVFGILSVAVPGVFGAHMAGAMPPMFWSIFVLAMGAACAVAGGYLTATIAIINPRKHVLALAGCVFVMGLVSMTIQSSNQPFWYALSLTFVGAFGAWLGGRIKMSASSFSR